MAEPDDRPGAHTDRTDAGERYRRCREAYSDLIRSLRDDELRATLPTCPGWSVHDVTAHLAGVAADVVNGVSPGADPEAWTATQVAVRRDTATSVVLREWERSASQLEVLLAKGDQRYPAYTLDVLCHEQDVRGAVGRPGRRDGPDLLAVADALGGRLQQLVESAALAQVAVIHDGEVWSGDPAAAVTFRADRFEFFRAMFGRRSRRQLGRRLEGADEPDRYLDVLPIFAPPTTDIVE